MGTPDCKPITHCAKHVLFNSMGLLDFLVGLVDSVHHLSNEQVIEVSLLENFEDILCRLYIQKF